MTVISTITFKSNLHACTLTYTDIYTGSRDNIIYHIPFNGKH